MSQHEDSDSLSRRAFLGAAAGAAATAGAASTATAQSTTTVQVGPGGNFVFSPGTDEPLYITPGTTVEFVWESDTHNIVVDSQPDGANWEGYETIENEGFTYEHTFETTGEYEYFCQPHQTSGMVGTIIVNEAGAPMSDGGGGPSLPDRALTLGVASIAAMVTTLSLAYFFLRYGGDYETPAE